MRFLTFFLCFVLIFAGTGHIGVYADEAWDGYANWYEVFVYSYSDSDGDGIGDLNGLNRKLDYIEDLGFTGLYLMPVMPSPSYHKYDVTDYTAIDPQYGTLEDFRSLVDACHARGIHIIIDLPVNHTSTKHPWFSEACSALKNGDTDNPYIRWYNFQETASLGYTRLEDTSWYYEERFTGGDMPDLNLDNPDVQNEIREILRFWLQDCDVDGFRLDAVTSYFTGKPEKNYEALNLLSEWAKSIRPDCYIVAEAWTSLSEIGNYYANTGIDSFFLFPVSQAEGSICRVIRDRNPASAYAKAVTQINEAIPDGILAPFLCNHDTARALGALQARSNLPRAKFAEGLLAMLGGNTFLYYGEEIGMVGSGSDPDKRIAMYWNDDEMTLPPPGATKFEYPYPCADDQRKDPDSLAGYIRELNHLKTEIPCITHGTTTVESSEDSLCILRRNWQDTQIRIVINFSAAEERTCSVLPSEALAGCLVTDSRQVRLENSVLALPPCAIAVLSGSGR